MKKNKNILYISFLGIFDPVGFSQVYSYIIKLCKDNELRFTLLTFEKKELLEKCDYLDYEKIKKGLSENNIEWHALKHHRGILKVYDLVRGFFKAFFIIKKNNIGIVHARSNEPIILAFFLSMIFDLKVVYDRRGMMAEDYSDDATTNIKIRKGGALYKLINKFDNYLMSVSDVVVVLTHKIKGHIIKETPFFVEGKNIFVIPCCIDLDRFNKFAKDNSPLIQDLQLEGKFIFNYTGSLCGLHSLDEMLAFFQVSKKIIPNAHFMFLTLVDKKYLETYIASKKLNMDDFTIVSASPDKVNEYLSICDASLMFFKPTFIRWAASPTKLAECLASGLPLVINKGIGDTEDLINENKVGVIVEDFSEKTYEHALNELLYLLKEPDIRLRCRDVAKSVFSIDKGISTYRKIYESLSLY